MSLNASRNMDVKKDWHVEADTVRQEFNVSDVHGSGDLKYSVESWKLSRPPIFRTSASF